MFDRSFELNRNYFHRDSTDSVTVAGSGEETYRDRKNTGNDDGKYELPGGHLEMGEDIYDAVIRESKEELLVDIKREDIRIVHLMHHYTKERLNFIFEIDGNLIDPKIGEEDKCEELVWVDILNLPNNISDKMRRIINNIVNNIEYDRM